jgi:hypothetical protein
MRIIQKNLGVAALLSVLALVATSVVAQDAQDEAKTDGRLSVVVGEVTVTPEGGEAAAAKQGDAVKVGSVIKTGPGARAVLVTTRQSAVRIAENSEVFVEDLVDSEATPKVLLDIKTGSMGALIQPQAQSAMDFRIKTPSGVAAARGTFYAVAVEEGEDGEKKGFVQVKSGKVAVTPKDAEGGEGAKPGTVSEMKGTLKLVSEDGTEKDLNVGDSVEIGSTVKTGPDSSAIIRLTKDSAVNMTANTEALVEVLDDNEDAPKVKLDLKNGTMSALIDPKVKGKMDFRIKTPSGVAAARGTFYSVAVENGRGYVNVKNGEVKVIPPGQAGAVNDEGSDPHDKDAEKGGGADAAAADAGNADADAN